MNLQAVIDLQRAEGLADVHVVYVGPTGFCLAHTDDERACGANTPECPVHQWLVEQDGPPAEVGLYVVVNHEPDAYSEDHRAEPYDLHPLTASHDQKVPDA